MRQRAISGCADVLFRHRWAIRPDGSRGGAAGPANPPDHDACSAIYERQGPDSTMVRPAAYLLLDAYIYGFALTKINLPFDASEEVAEVAQGIAPAVPVNEYPNLVAYIGRTPQARLRLWGRLRVGLDLILDGLEKARATA